MHKIEGSDITSIAWFCFRKFIVAPKLKPFDKELISKPKVENSLKLIAVLLKLLKELEKVLKFVELYFAYIGVFGQQCRSSTGHFCNEIF
jgi:hypothetical protein